MIAQSFADAHPPTGEAGVAMQYTADPVELMRYLDHLLALRRSGIRAASESDATVTGCTGLAVFFIELRRSDRTLALAGRHSARIVSDVVCSRIAEILRPDDRFAMNGVDELLLVLPDVDSAGRAHLVASRLVQTLQEPMRDLPQAARIRPAIGCALFPAHGDDAEQIIAAADAASRAARPAEEGYRIAVRDEGSAEDAQLLTDFELALGANQLQVWLQPQLDLRTGRLDAAEALIRWPRAEGLPPVSPIVAVGLAEAHGLMPDLTLFVLKTVLRESAQFRRRGIDLRIAINLSASMLTDRNLAATVQQNLELWDVAPDRLTIEVTENTLMQDVEGSLAMLHQLKALGTHLSLDDFGTGYSSFAYLRRMPLDELKIDQLFIRKLGVRPDGSFSPERDADLRIVRSIIDFAHSLDLYTVAEGVEDQSTLDVLESMGCDVIQGYFTGRPMPIPQYDNWWRERQC